MFESFLQKQKINELSFQNLIDFSFYHLKTLGLVIRYNEDGELLFAKIKYNEKPTPDTWISHKFSLSEGFDCQFINNKYIETSNLSILLNFIQDIDDIIIKKEKKEFVAISKNIEVRTTNILESMLRLKLKLLFGETLLFPKLTLTDDECDEYACFQIYPIFGDCEGIYDDE